MVLEQSVSQQVDIFGQLPTMKACGFPNVSGLSLLTSFQFGQHIFSAVATTGSANFPEVGCRHVFEVSSRRAQLRMMEDGFSTDQFL